MVRSFVACIFVLFVCASGNAADMPRISPVSIMAQQAPNVAAWVLSPLDRSVPGDIRQNLTFLREDLLDEAKTNPKASVDAYKFGYHLCSNMIAALDERDQALVRAGVIIAEADARTGVTNQTLEARRNSQMSWPQYARESDQRDELKNQAVNKAAVLKERPKVEWAGRVTQLRVNLDALYAKFREALRTSPQLTSGAIEPVAKDAPVTAEKPLPAPPPLPSQKGSGASESVNEAVLQVLVGSKAASGATIIVTKAHPEEEESLVKEEKTEDGKVTFAVTPGSKYNVYAFLEGHDFFMKKGCSAANLPQPVLRPLAPNKSVSLGQKGIGLPLFGGDVTDMIPVRANQGSPVFEWIFKGGESGAVADGGRAAANGEFWLKQGEMFRLGGEKKKTSFKFVTSIARKYVVFESR